MSKSDKIQTIVLFGLGGFLGGVLLAVKLIEGGIIH